MAQGSVYPKVSREKNCARIIGEGCRFERIRRITGYLVGTIDRFNNAKKAEVLDRVIHIKIGGQSCCH